ncbi:MAG: hypothetical protein AB1Z98_17100 [Nannocystaceae bacterium]
MSRTPRKSTSGPRAADSDADAPPPDPSPGEEGDTDIPVEDLAAEDHAEATSSSDDDDEIRRLARALRRELEHREGCQAPQPSRLQQDTLAELLVLATAVRTLAVADREPPPPSRIDEYVEDMIDPEFGLRPARKIITEAAEHILRGYEGLALPRQRRRPGQRLDED